MGRSVGDRFRRTGDEHPFSTRPPRSDPVQYVWQFFQSLRRENTLSIAGVLTGPQSHFDVQRRAGGERVLQPGGRRRVRSRMPSCCQRLILKVAADTYGDPITLTLEILGTETLPPTFVAGVLSAGTIAAPVNLGSALQLSLDPFNAPFAIAMTDFGAVKQIAGSPPKLTLSAQTPQRVPRRIGRRHPPQSAGARVRGDRLAGFMGREARRDDLRARRSPSRPREIFSGSSCRAAASSCAGNCCFVSTPTAFISTAASASARSWPDVVHLPGVVIHSLVDERGGLGLRLPDQRQGHDRGFSRTR